MKKTFNVSGMKCSHCAANVENALKAVKGVVSAEAQLDDKTVTVEFDGQQTSEADLKAAVDATGRYELTD
ncbi:MAG TPA: copper resistance protein CopZ [Prevotella sp.]|nr:copper resistance protein CopZ [Prevotella sp.]